jgi:hypothetical protein
MSRIGWMVWAGIALVGCQNPCQQVCQRMADYATECGLAVSDGEVGACVDRMGQDLAPEDKQACRDFGDPDVIRTQWTCQDLAVYWAPSS